MQFFSLAFIAILVGSLSVARANENPSSPESSSFNFKYNVEVEAVPAGEGPVDIFVPLAKSDEHQEVIKRDVQASIKGEIAKDAEYGNEFWHGHLDKSDGKPVTVAVDYSVQRKKFSRELLEANKNVKYSAAELAPLKRWLEADTLVPVSGSLIEKVQKDLPQTDPVPLARARAIYDYVVATMEYKKVGTGWGNGSTEWACSQRYGNCTDFHSLFISLARAEKIPSKFEIGFSIPSDKPEGEIAGYHCWAEFYLPKTGWVPIDASEAKKHPEMKEVFFGTHPADRFQFTTGRDIKLGAGHTGKPLNYFIFPYVEVKGEKYEKFKRTFNYSNIAG